MRLYSPERKNADTLGREAKLKGGALSKRGRKVASRARENKLKSENKTRRGEKVSYYRQRKGEKANKGRMQWNQHNVREGGIPLNLQKKQRKGGTRGRKDVAWGTLWHGGDQRGDLGALRKKGDKKKTWKKVCGVRSS